MAISNFKRCPVCGQQFNYCSKCENIASWKSVVDTHRCFQIHMVLTQLRESMISEKQAYEQLSNIGFTLQSDFSNLLEGVSKELKRIIVNGNANKIKSKSNSKTTITNTK